MAKRVFKSTRKVSSVRCVYRKWAEWDVGDILIGKYIKQQIDNYDKPNYLVKVEDAQFQDLKAGKKLVGEVIGLNSSGKLDAAMEDVNIGEMIQVEYKGTSTIEKGKFKGKEAHDIEVDVVVEEGEDGHESQEEEPEDGDGDDL